MLILFSSTSVNNLHTFRIFLDVINHKTSSVSTQLLRELYSGLRLTVLLLLKLEIQLVCSSASSICTTSFVNS